MTEANSRISNTISTSRMQISNVEWHNGLLLFDISMINAGGVWPPSSAGNTQWQLHNDAYVQAHHGWRTSGFPYVDPRTGTNLLH